jgi:PadR family transcriptional regulator PadR
MQKKDIFTEKVLKGMLDFLLVTLINGQPMHGYHAIVRFRGMFGIYFGASTIYPMLAELERLGYIVSKWDLNNGRPKKVYSITSKGQQYIYESEEALHFILRKIGISSDIKVGICEQFASKEHRKL